MITLVEALNYRCLRYIRQPLDRFHVLVGPNASGKTTFLEVAGFISRMLSSGLQEAIREITPDPRDLLFGRRGESFELAVEAAIPERFLLSERLEHDRIRYELAVTVDPITAVPTIRSEAVRFLTDDQASWRQVSLFPDIIAAPETLVSRRTTTKAIVTKNPESGKDNFYPEVKKGKGKGWVPSFQLGPQRSAFANLPEDETRFPVSTWFKDFLINGVQRIVLDSQQMRLASPPGQPRHFKTNGTNLPWVVEEFRKQSERFRDWIAHLQTALPDVEDVRTVEREDTRHRHIVIVYHGGLQVPSWMVSDGTLRLLALTLPAYLEGPSGIFLIEEPENGIHPRAVETVFQSLASVYDSQILLATHSPMILGIAEPRQVLCFAKNDAGETDVVRGDLHPMLADWRHDVDLGTLFASGVLG